MIAVEVRQGTLKWMFVVEVRKQTLAWMVVVEVRQGTLGVDGRGEDEEEEKEDEEEEATNIKSNNPHLAGGEIQIFHVSSCVLMCPCHV